MSTSPLFKPPSNPCSRAISNGTIYMTCMQPFARRRKQIMNTETSVPDTSFLGRLASFTMILACVSLICVALVEGWQVFARYVLGESPSWTEPVTLLFMGTAMMGGAAVGVRTNRHFGFFMLVDYARPNIKRVLVLVP